MAGIPCQRQDNTELRTSAHAYSIDNLQTCPARSQLLFNTQRELWSNDFLKPKGLGGGVNCSDPLMDVVDHGIDCFVREAFATPELDEALINVT